VVAANDFSTGTIRPWLISRPTRSGVFAGKLVASMVIALILAVVIGAVSYAATGLFGTVPTMRDMGAAFGEFALACVALSVFGHAIGVLTRSVPAALAITIGWILPVEKVLQGRSRVLDQWLPGNLLQDITVGQLGHGQTPAGAVLHAVVPFLLLAAIAMFFFLRRDINN
jgi:ABC-type transport system involved in multi-copper enzyme maturation permease subunit